MIPPQTVIGRVAESTRRENRGGHPAPILPQVRNLRGLALPDADAKGDKRPIGATFFRPCLGKRGLHCSLQLRSNGMRGLRLEREPEFDVNGGRKIHRFAVLESGLEANLLCSTDGRVIQSVP